MKAKETMGSPWCRLRDPWSRDEAIRSRQLLIVPLCWHVESIFIKIDTVKKNVFWKWLTQIKLSKWLHNEDFVNLNSINTHTPFLSISKEKTASLLIRWHIFERWSSLRIDRPAALFGVNHGRIGHTAHWILVGFVFNIVGSGLFVHLRQGTPCLHLLQRVSICCIIVSHVSVLLARWWGSCRDLLDLFELLVSALHGRIKPTFLFLDNSLLFIHCMQVIIQGVVDVTCVV